jgi:hypothetical protein|tara:strand:- start:10 stop:228 length:219 start_codon:yes stop_codon:yes gene_type:complete
MSSIINVKDLVLWEGKVFQISNLKSNFRGLWVQFALEPTTTAATSCPQNLAECWFDISSLDLYRKDKHDEAK